MHSITTNRSLVVNCSIMLTELPLPQRLQRIADHGFDSVECWWPFTTSTPSAEDVDAFARAIERSGMALVALNLLEGDMPGGERGPLSTPGRRDELLASADVAVRLGHRLGVRRCNVLYGNRIPGIDPAEQDAIAIDTLAEVASRLAAIDATVLVEPLSGAADYPLRTADDGIAVIDAVHAAHGVDNVGLLLDLYHLAVNGDDVPSAIARHATRAAHMQVADAPGRGVPGSGTLPLVGWASQAREAGYAGRIALEHLGGGRDPFALLDHERWRDLA